MANIGAAAEHSATTQPGMQASGRARYSILAIAFLIFVAFSDGLGYFTVEKFGLPSPYLITFPTLITGIICACLFIPGLRLRKIVNSVLAILILTTGLLLVQVSLNDKINILGYGQLVLFLVCLFATRLIYEAAPPRLIDLTLGAVVFVHYLQCAFIVITIIVWHSIGQNINLIDLMSDREIVEYYGYRASGLAREPAWAAMGISVTYLTIHLLQPARRTPALLAFIIAAIFIKSGTTYVLGTAFAIAYLIDRRSMVMWISGAIIALAGTGLLTYDIWDRIMQTVNGTDPSISMRLASAQVAVQVIGDTFPLGSGYGNFRNFGIYGTEFDHFIDLSLISNYKSDILLLNLVAELGVAGIVFAWVLLRIFSVPGHILPTILCVVILVLFGTALVPCIVVLAATSGILSAARKPLATPPPTRANLASSSQS